MNKIDKTKSILNLFEEKGEIEKSGLAFLCHDSNWDTIEAEDSIENTQLFLDLGIYVLESKMSHSEKLSFIKISNYLGYLEDRHTYNLYVHQDKIRKILSLVLELQIDNSNLVIHISERLDSISSDEIGVIKKQMSLYRTVYKKIKGKTIVETPDIADDDLELQSTLIKLKKYRNDMLLNLMINSLK